MWFVKTRNYFFISLLLFHMNMQGNVTDVCTPQVIYARATVNYSIGDTLELNCTVKFCKPESLNIYWCKVEANNCKPLNMSYRVNTIFNTTFLVYKTFLNNTNDTGIYQCVADQTSSFAKGHLITVYVHGVKVDSHETRITETRTNSSMDPANTPLSIFYIVIAVGTVGVTVLLIMVTIFCIRNFHEPLETDKSSTCSARHQYHDMTELNGKPTNYENMNECSEDIGSSSPSPLTVNKCNSPRNQNSKFSNTAQQDTIIYASLNESTLNRKPSVKFTDNENTEYAAINVKN